MPFYYVTFSILSRVVGREEFQVTSLLFLKNKNVAIIELLYFQVVCYGIATPCGLETAGVGKLCLAESKLGWEC